MADEWLTEKQAREWLARAVAREGSAGRLAKRIGVSKAFISQMTNGHQAITGKVADYLGLKKVNAYELTLVKPSTEQEQYTNSRRAWMEHHPPIPADEINRRLEEAARVKAEKS